MSDPARTPVRIALIVAVVAVLGAGVWWLTRPAPDSPANAADADSGPGPGSGSGSGSVPGSGSPPGAGIALPPLADDAAIAPEPDVTAGPVVLPPPTDPDGGPIGQLAGEVLGAEMDLARPDLPVSAGYVQERVAQYRKTLPAGQPEPTTLLVDDLFPPSFRMRYGLPEGTRFLMIDGQPPGAVGALDAFDPKGRQAWPIEIAVIDPAGRLSKHTLQLTAP